MNLDNKLKSLSGGATVEVLQNAYLNTALTQQQREIQNDIWQKVRKKFDDQ